jgi:hypothetical protein
MIGIDSLSFRVTTAHSRSKNGVASLAYDPAVHGQVHLSMDCRIKSGNDELSYSETAAGLAAVGRDAAGIIIA